MFGQGKVGRGWSWELHVSETKESIDRNPVTEEEAGGTKVGERTHKKGGNQNKCPRAELRAHLRRAVLWVRRLAEGRKP